MSPRIAATPLLATSLLALAAALPLAGLAARHATTVRATVAAAPSADVGHASVTVTLYHDALEWRTAPWLFVSAVVTHVEGLRSDGRGGEVGRDGRGFGRATGDGRVTVRLSQGTGRLFRPDDTVTIVASSLVASRIGPPLTFTIPELRVDVVPDRTALEGIAAPGAVVRLDVDAPPDGLPDGLPDSHAPAGSTTVTAGPTGRFRWAFGDGAPLAPGQGGWATTVDGDGNAFRARFAALQLRVGVGRATGSGWVTPADDLDILYPIDQGRGLRTIGLNAATISPDGRRRYGGAYTLSSMAGTPLTVTIQSPILGTRHLGTTLPTLSVDTVAPDHAAGTAPPGTALAVEVFAADDGTEDAADRDAPPITRIAATANADGLWRVDIPPATPLRAGGRVEAVLHLGDGLEAAAAALVPRFTVAVEGARFSADVPSKGSYVFTVRAPDGALIGRTGVLLGADADDRMTIDFEPHGSWWGSDSQLPAGAQTALQRGGSIEVEEKLAGTQLRLAIPPLSATTDDAADAFAGTAPAGAALDVDVLGPFGTRRFAVTADATGRWSLSVAGRIDVTPGIGARVWYADPAGHRFYVDTAVVRIVADPDSNHLEAGPWTGRAVREDVIDPAGRLVGSASAPADVGPSDEVRRQALMTTGTELRDRLGNRPQLRAGDTIRAYLGDDEAAWVLPPLEARIDPERAIIEGRTLPGTRLVIGTDDLDDPLAITTTVTADAAGDYRADFSDRVDGTILGGLYVRGTFGPHTLRRFVVAPAVELDFERAQLSGVLEPYVVIDVRILHGVADSVLATGRTTSDARGRFTVDLRTMHGAPFVARGGQRIIVDAAAARTYGHVAFEVPDFSLNLGSTGRFVEGDRPKVGTLTLRGGTVQSHWPIGGVRDSVKVTEVQAAPERWTGVLDGVLAPGDRITARLDTGGGRTFVRSLTVAILGIEHGGGRICGYAAPFDRALLTLVDGDRQSRAFASFRTGADGVINGRWDHSVDDAVVTRPGDRVVGQVGPSNVDIPVGDLTATLDLTAGVLHSVVRPGFSAVLTSPSRGCLFRITADEERWLGVNGLTPARESDTAARPPATDGRVAIPVPPAPYPQAGIDLHIASESRDRIFRTVYRTLTLEANLTEGIVAGFTRPHAAVRLTVHGQDGGVRIEVATTADASGAFSARAVDAARQPIALRPGDRVSAVAARADDGIGSETAMMTVEDLAVDMDDLATAIRGRAPAGRTVDFALRTVTSDRRWVDATVGADGRFALRADDIPPRAGWALADIASGRAELAQAGGHRTIVQWTRSANGLFLPWMERRR